MARESGERRERGERHGSQNVEMPQHYNGHHRDQNMENSVPIGHPINEDHRSSPPAGEPGRGDRQHG